MEGNFPARFPPPSLPDRDFAFCKIMYNSVRYEHLGMGWATDYPYAGINLMIRFSELTTGRVSLDDRGDPNHWVVRFTDDALFNCPFTMAADVGTIGFSNEEVVRLREYLLKGGFPLGRRLLGLSRVGALGARDWARAPAVAVSRPRRAPEPPGVPHADARARGAPDHGHPVLVRCRGGARRRNAATTAGNRTFERLPTSTAACSWSCRTNTDVADAWEREAEDPRFFERFSPDGYGLGINVLLYTMMH